MVTLVTGTLLMSSIVMTALIPCETSSGGRPGGPKALTGEGEGLLQPALTDPGQNPLGEVVTQGTAGAAGQTEYDSAGQRRQGSMLGREGTEGRP